MIPNLTELIPTYFKYKMDRISNISDRRAVAQGNSLVGCGGDAQRDTDHAKIAIMIIVATYTPRLSDPVRARGHCNILHIKSILIRDRHRYGPTHTPDSLRYQTFYRTDYGRTDFSGTATAGDTERCISINPNALQLEEPWVGFSGSGR